jgi:hypothetical protein
VVPRATERLIVTDEIIREIAREIHMKFMLHTENISLHFAPHAIIIHIFPRVGELFQCPNGEVDVRLERDKYEILGPHVR